MVGKNPRFCTLPPSHPCFVDLVHKILESESEDVKWDAVGGFGGKRASSVKFASHPCFHPCQRTARDEGTFKGEN